MCLINIFIDSFIISLKICAFDTAKPFERCRKIFFVIFQPLNYVCCRTIHFKYRICFYLACLLLSNKISIYINIALFLFFLFNIILSRTVEFTFIASHFNFVPIPRSLDLIETFAFDKFTTHGNQTREPSKSVV